MGNWMKKREDIYSIYTLHPCPEHHLHAYIILMKPLFYPQRINKDFTHILRRILSKPNHRQLQIETWLDLARLAQWTKATQAKTITKWPAAQWAAVESVA